MTKEPGSPRLASLDALRGFDMFWIVGGRQLLHVLAAYFDNKPFTDLVNRHTTHVGWEGCVAWDLIFPLFVFMTGVTMPLTLTRRLERGEKKRVLYWRIFRRMVLLVLLGMAPGLFQLEWAQLRLFSVLGLIGVAYFLAGMVVIHRGIRGQIIWVVGLLVGYCAALNFIPVPGIGAGVITPGGHLGGYIDRNIVSVELDQKVFDPEGTLNYLPAAALALIGAVTGRFLLRANFPPVRKSVMLFIAGAAMLGLGYLWNIWFPIIKCIWSSSYILVAAGWGMMLLSLFFLVIDVWGQRWLGFVFVPVGMNAITIYVARSYINFEYTAERVFGGLARHMGEDLAPIAMAVAVLVVEWMLLYFMYRRRIFLRA